MRDYLRSVARPLASAALALTLVGGVFALGAAAPAAATSLPEAATLAASQSETVRPAAAVAAADGDWFTSWAQSQDRRSGNTFTEQTFRMITHLSQGGDEVRIRLQNQYGAGPITVDATAVAVSVGGAATVDGTSRTLAFGGLPSVTIPAGGEVWSDTVPLETKAQDDLAVSMYVKGPMVPSLHSYPYRDNYVSAKGAGDKVSESTGAPFIEKLAWTYLVSAVDVHNTELIGTIVAYGSSVVDGEGSQNCGQSCTAMGTDRRWSDDLARRINSELPEYAQLAVANEGIAGTTSSPVCGGGGNDGVNRLDRDVLALHGVTGVIYYYGTNDLANGCTGDDILASYKNVFQRLKDAGIAVYVTPMTPRFTYTEQQNAYRSMVNEFVRSGGNCSGYCDGVLDFDEVLKDPAKPNSVLAKFDAGDGGHANVAGQQAIANSISLPMLASSGLAPDDTRPLIKTVSKYDFEDGFQGWQAGSNVGSVGWYDGFANGPKTPFAGDRVMGALSRYVPANAMRTLFVAPPEPLDLSAATELVAHIDSYGGLGGATGYEAAITLTGAGGEVLTQTFPMAPDQWTELRLDVSGWAERSAVSKMEIGFRGLGVSSVWVPHFQIDEVTWDATLVAPVITSGDPVSATVDSEYSFTVTATGDPVPTIAVTAGALPVGLELDATTGVISGTPSEAGAATFTVAASNGVQSDATAEYTLTVDAAPVVDDDWFTSWAQSQDRRSGITFTNQTFRMITHLSQGGDEMRIRLQNQYGAEPITVDAAAVAVSAGGAATVEGTNRTLAFDGQPSVTIPVGGEVWSDSVALETKAQDDIAVSMYVDAPVVPSLHSAPFRDNYVSTAGSGNHVTDEAGSSFSEKMGWTYLVSAVDVHNTELIGTVVSYGSSVVDGEGSQNCGQGCTEMGTDRRWSDDLARRINSELPEYAQMAVANAGIGGTTSSPDCAGGGNDGVNRLDRDVLALNGVTAVILYYGTNDLANNACTAETILSSYANVFQRLKDAGIEVYVTPITPRPSYTEQQNTHRTTVNDFVRAGGNCSGTCDGVVDFDEVLRDTANPNAILAPYDTGDGVHANVAGQQAIANSISLAMLASSGLAPDDTRPLIKTVSKYDFEDGFQGWQAGSNVGAVGWDDGFANGPKTPFAGDRVMGALSRYVPANAMRTLFVSPPEPLDLSAATELVAHIDSYGGLGGATGYEAVVTLTGAGGEVLSQAFPMTPDQWTELKLDISGWAERSAVSKMEIGFRGLGVSSVWVPHFQIDEVTWEAALPVLVAPVITSGAPVAGTVGSAYSFTVTATGDPVPTFAVTEGALPAGLELDATTGVISGVPSEAGAVSFTVAASNGVDPAATAEYTMTVAAAPVELVAPVITSGEPGAATAGTAYSFMVTATGSPAPTFAVTAGALPVGLSLDATTGAISGTPNEAATATFTVTAANGVDPAAAAEYTIAVAAAPAELVAPVITSGAPVAGTVGSAYSFTVTATGDPVPTFAVTEGALPAGLELDATTGVISGVPSEAGAATFTVTASNGTDPDAIAEYTLTVEAAPPVLVAPVITSGAPVAATAGVAYEFMVTATGSPAPTFAVTTGALPAGLSLDATTGVISGIPAEAETATFTVTASNGIGPDATAEYMVEVAAAPAELVAPVITSGAPVAATAGVAYEFMVTATGSPAPTFVVTAGALPAGLSLDATSGVISGIPAEAETATFTVTASNGVGPDAVAEYTLTVSAAPTEPGTPTPPADPVTPSAPTDGTNPPLAKTGFELLPAGALVAFLVLIGASLLVRRRRELRQR